MAKISIKEKIAMSTLISLVFTGISVTKTSDGQNIITFDLETPRDVKGSQEVEIDGVMQRVRANDATEVSILEEDLEAVSDNFSWDTDMETGEYEGTELILDVAKSNGKVWLKPTTFAVSGRQFGAQQRSSNFKKMFGSPVAKAAAPKAGEQLVDTNK